MQSTTNHTTLSKLKLRDILKGLKTTQTYSRRTYKDEGTGKFLSFSWLCKYSNTCHLCCGSTAPLEDAELWPPKSWRRRPMYHPRSSPSSGPCSSSSCSCLPSQVPHDSSCSSSSIGVKHSSSTLQGFGLVGFGFGKGGWLGRIWLW